MTIQRIQIDARPFPGPVPPDDGPRDELFDWPKVHRYLRFALRSVRRRPWLFLCICAGMILGAAGVLAVMPKTYEVETRLLAQKNAVLAVRSDGNAWETPTRSAADTILSRDNLHALIRETDLIQEWPKRRAPVLRLKDWLMTKLMPPATEEERLKALTGLLENNLMVWTTPEGTVNIRLRWPDGLMAYRLVDAAERNYVETRHVAEIATVAEQIAILEAHAATLKGDVDKELAELQRLRDRAAPKAHTAATRATAPVNPADSPEIINLRVMLDAKRRAIADLEEFRRHHVLEQQTRLTELSAVYSENNPLVANLRQSVQALQNDSPQLQTLRQEEAELRKELARRAGGLADAAEPGVPAIPQDLFRAGLGDDPAIEYARSQLQFAAVQYATMRERVASARLDLDTARAAFKHRYSVVVPPEIPRGPIKPKGPLVMIAATVAGLLLAIFGTTSADLRRGAVLERWQLERLLGPSRGIPVIELHLP